MMGILFLGGYNIAHAALANNTSKYTQKSVQGSSLSTGKVFHLKSDPSSQEKQNCSVETLVFVYCDDDDKDDKWVPFKNQSHNSANYASVFWSFTGCHALSYNDKMFSDTLFTGVESDRNILFRVFRI